MANDFSGDANCMALYRFESGAVLVDSKGDHDLTGVASIAANNEARYVREGSYCGNFNNGEGDMGYVLDADLAAGFPFKNGASNNQFSCAFWWAPFYTSSPRWVCSKWDTGKLSIGVCTTKSGAANYHIQLHIGYNNGASVEIIDLYQDLPTTPCHIGITYNAGTKAYYARLWNGTTASEVSGTTTNAPTVADAPFCVGGRFENGSPEPPSSNTYSGVLDELVIFNDLLTADEIDDIRGGTYSTAAAPAEGVLEQTLGSLTISATGAVKVAGLVSGTLDAATISAAGMRSNKLIATLLDVAITATGEVAVAGAASVTLGALTTTDTAGKVAVVGSLSAQLGDATLQGTAAHHWYGNVNEGLDLLSLAATGSAITRLALSSTLDPVLPVATAEVLVQGELSASLPGLTIDATGLVRIAGVAAIILDALTGVGSYKVKDPLYLNPEITLEWSDDGGITWSNAHSKPLSRAGEYRQMKYWDRLGRSRDRVFRVSISDPVKVILVDAWIDFDEGLA